MKKYLFIPACMIALLGAVGCAKSTGIMPWAPGVYSVTAEVDKTLFTTHTDAERQAHQEAAAFCDSQGQMIHVRNFDHSTTRWYYTVKLIFSCEPAGVEQPVMHGYKKIDIEAL